MKEDKRVSGEKLAKLSATMLKVSATMW